MYGTRTFLSVCSRTMQLVSVTGTDECARATRGELVGNTPHTRWLPNMLPKLLARGAPLP